MNILVTVEEMVEKGNWDRYCEDNGINPWAISEGLMSSQDNIELSEQEACKYGILKEEDKVRW